MQLIIDIDDVLYYKICSLKDSEIDTSSYMAIKNGKLYEEKPTGHWTEYHTKTDLCYGKVYYQHEKCSCNLYESPYKFCPNCGAVMEKENETDN